LLRANKVHTHGEESTRNDKNEHLIVDPYMAKTLGSSLGLFQSPLVTIECMIWHWVQFNNPNLLVTELFFGCHLTACKHHRLKVVGCWSKSGSVSIGPLYLWWLKQIQSPLVGQFQSPSITNWIASQLATKFFWLLIVQPTIGNWKFSVTFKLEEWWPNFFDHRLSTHPIGDWKNSITIQWCWIATCGWYMGMLLDGDQSFTIAKFCGCP
jgi:hypothetical protein